MKSKVCRMAFGDQESANLVNDEDVGAYIGLCEGFDKVFCHSINFGGLYFLEIMMPTTFALSSRLGDALSTSGIIHLNIHCGHSPHFLQNLQTPSWRRTLERLQVFRIKYIVSVEEVRSSIYHPQQSSYIYSPRTEIIPTHGIILYGLIYSPLALLSRCFC